MNRLGQIGMALAFFCGLPACGANSGHSSLKTSPGAAVSHFNADGSDWAPGMHAGKYSSHIGTVTGSNIEWSGGSNDDFLVFGPYAAFGSGIGPGGVGHLHGQIDIAISLDPNADHDVVWQEGAVTVDFTYNAGSQNLTDPKTINATPNHDWQTIDLDGGIWNAPDVRNAVEIRVYHPRSTGHGTRHYWVDCGTVHGPRQCPQEQNFDTDGNLRVSVGQMRLIYD